MLEEFKKFAMRGNVVDMAVGIVIGAAFGKIVSSFVKDVLMPPLGKLMGGVDFSNLFINLGTESYASLAAAQEAGAATINYGVFINTVLDFLIVAFAIFMVIKAMNKLKKEEPVKAPDTKACPQCLSDIPIAAKRCKFCTSQID
ncbi:MAG TPA: large conductance mechanosensitive channel protein MscL [Gammaproteobacteria bacterium]|nr:large conductance mechanosensitive channel protein MscL [Gammaproteobacteria bacterium]